MQSAPNPGPQDLDPVAAELEALKAAGVPVELLPPCAAYLEEGHPCPGGRDA